jgi:hypothetical protein
MSNKRSIEKMEAEISQIQEELAQLGPMHPGSISQQYQVCGNPSCKCMRKENPQRHGPYAKLSFTRRSKRVCRFVRADCVEPFEQRLAIYKEFKKLTDRWVALSIKIGELKFFSGK